MKMNTHFHLIMSELSTKAITENWFKYETATNEIDRTKFYKKFQSASRAWELHTKKMNNIPTLSRKLRLMEFENLMNRIESGNY